MKRRSFVKLLSLAAAWPPGASGDRARVPVIGFLGVRSPEDGADLVAGFRQGLRETGYVEGKNVQIEFRWAYGQYDKLPALAADLVRRKVTVITAQGAPAAVVAKSVTAAIPIVFYMGEDPVELGVVTSLNQPAANITGVADLSSALVAKRMELLRDLVPAAKVVTLLVNPKHPSTDAIVRDASTAAGTLARRLHVLKASTPDELEGIFPSLRDSPVRALLVAPDGFFNGRAQQLADLCMRYGIPASSERRNFPAAGGLMSYGGSNHDGLRLTGVSTGRVLKGQKTAELPVVQATKVELVVNLKAAGALGLAVPRSILLRADEVIR